MKVFVLFSISLAVAVGRPPVVPDALKHLILTEDQHPPVGNWLPVQDHVVAEEPAPQLRLEEAEKTGEQENIQVEEKPQVKDEPQLQAPADFKVDLDAKEKPEDKKPEQGPEAIPADKVDPEPPSPDLKVESEVKVDPEPPSSDLKVESEVKVEPESQKETEFEAKSETGLEDEEKHMDMEGTYEKMDQPIMHLEPINEEDDVKSEEEKQNDKERTYETMDQPIMHLEPVNDEDAANVNSEDEMSEEELAEAEKAIMTAFQRSDPVADEQRLSEEEEEEAPAENNEAVMILEPEVSSDQEQVMPGVYMMDEGPRLDALGEPMLPFEEYFPNKEDFIGLEPAIQQNPLMNMDMMMRENPDQEFVDGEESVMDPMPVMDETETDGDYQRFSLSQSRQGRGYSPRCAGVVLQGRCYEFHRGPKRAEEAEFFCQRSATGGHLASITTKHVHREVMRLILKTNGAYTRTWIGGLRYLGTGRFVWLDGAHWNYADWLSGEPNNTADKEDCVEVLAHGPGKFNDFTCWEPQAFVCSYPYQ